MALGKNYETQECVIARALEVVGERWTFLIVRDLFYGVRRYSDLLAHLGLPRAVLAARLQGLTEAGVLEKQRYEQSPPRDEYVLTPLGRRLWPALYALLQWGYDVTGSEARYIFSHAGCGADLDPYGRCPRCAGDPPPPEEVGMRPSTGKSRNPSDPVARALLRPHRLLEPLRIAGAGVSPAAAPAAAR